MDLTPNTEVELSNINGQILYSGNNNEIETSSFPKGIYVLKIRQNGITTLFKVCKN
jgi:hypothetical protein